MSRFLTKISAWSIYFSILGVYIFSLSALVGHRQEGSLWTFSETLRIIKYSTLQAGASAVLSVLCGVLLARALFYLEFGGKKLLYKIISFVWALPSLVIIFAVIGVWGNSGWLVRLTQWLGFERHFQLYGLQGILIAHLIFNVPLVTKYCLEGLHLIPSGRHRLAAQMNLSGWSYFRIVEFPMLKGVLPYAFMNVFLVCFTSFPIVLMLGGSPKYSTLEVAVYQAVTFEFDFAKAVALIAAQIVVGIVLQLLADTAGKYAFRTTKQYMPTVGEIWKPKPTGMRKRLLQAVVFLQSFAIILPLVSVVWAGLSVSAPLERLLNPLLWKSAWFSLLLSLIASVTVISIAYLIALEARRLNYHRQKIKYSVLAGVATYPLILPVFLLAVGLFLLLTDVELGTPQLLLLVGICNGLTLLPFIYRLIFSAMWYSLSAQDNLAQSLGLKGFRRWWIVEKNYLVRPLLNAFALAMSSSLGSFAVIAFFGSPDFSSLPYLLYQQLGSYRSEDAAVTALVLMLFALLPFLFIEREQRKVV